MRKWVPTLCTPCTPEMRNHYAENWAPEPNYTTLMYASEVLKHCSNVKSNVVVFKITSQTEKVMPTNKTNNFFANKSKYDINDNWWDFPMSIGTINNSDWFPPKLRVNWGNQINFDFGLCGVRVSAEPTMWPFYSAYFIFLPFSLSQLLWDVMLPAVQLKKHYPVLSLLQNLI